MKSPEREKNIRVLIVGVVAYTLLHAVMFVGGSESLLYNLRGYFWILLVLDIITNLLTRESLWNDIIRAIPLFKSSNESDDNEDAGQYRLIVPAGTEKDIEETESSKERTKTSKKRRKKINEKQSVSFSNPLTETKQIGNNSYANTIPDRDVPTIEKLLEQKLVNGEVGNKSTPLNQLTMNINESGFSDSDSDFTTDLDNDFSNFERGLSF